MEEEIDLRVYVEVLVRNWMWIAGLALAAAAVAFAVSSFIPPTYEATALAAITEPRYVMRFDPRFEAVSDIEPVYEAYPELATCDDLLLDLMAQLDTLPEGVESLQDVREMVEATAGADPSMVRLTVRSQDPEAAARIANGWVELFVIQANEIYGAHSEEETRFFEDQLTQAEADLEAAEQALVVFQARNEGSILGAQLASAKQDLQDYLVEQREIERAVRNARALQASISDQPADALVSPGDDLTALLLQVQAFTELETEPPIWLQISDATRLSSERTAGELVVFLDGLAGMLETREEEIEAQVAALGPRILALQQQLQESQAEGNGLTRTRDVAQETYMTIARKVEEARIAADDTTGEVHLVSRAAVPESPVGPRKMPNTAVAGALGLMVGVFGVFALEWWGGDEGQRE